jgi:hypothetical protein
MVSSPTLGGPSPKGHLVTPLHRLLRLTLVCSAATVLACSDNGAGPNGNGTVTAKIDGASWDASAEVQATYIAYVLAVGGLDSQARAIVISVPSVTATGTFSLAAGQPAFATVTFGAETWSSAITGGTGSVIVSTLTGSHAIGTFSFTAPGSTSGATGTKVVTSGTFDVRY